METPALAGISEAPFAGQNMQYFLSARCALLALCKARRPRVAWLPSYLCGSLQTPFLQSGVAIRYYGIDQHLQVAETSWIGEVRAGDLVLVIHYFGVPHRNFPIDWVKARGALLVEDASQALFLPQQFPESTCILYSPRKFLGVPDSGILVSHGETGIESSLLQEPPRNWWRAAVAMSLKRRDFDISGQPNAWYSIFRRVEAELPVGLYRASDLSRVLVANLDYDAIRQRRRANYDRLLLVLGDYAIFPELGPDVVPCGFPVRVDRGRRDRVASHLHARQIFVPVHWPIERIVPAAFHASHELALSCVTLINDQRCVPEDMDRQARAFVAAVTEDDTAVSEGMELDS